MLNRYALIHFLSCRFRTFDRVWFAVKLFLWLVNRSECTDSTFHPRMEWYQCRWKPGGSRSLFSQAAPPPCGSSDRKMHVAHRQHWWLPGNTLMYAHIGRLAILHISNVRFICTWEKKIENVAISGLKRTRGNGFTVSPKPWPYAYAQSFLNVQRHMAYFAAPESTNKRIVSDDSP